MPQQNANKRWSKEDVTLFKKLIIGNTPTPLIAYKLGRTEKSIESKANDLGLSLKPVNKSPYNRQKK